MGQQILMESEDAVATAAELVPLAGQSRDTAVTQAVRERLERKRPDRYFGDCFSYAQTDTVPALS